MHPTARALIAAIAFIGFLPVGAFAAEVPWPTVHKDAQRSGYSEQLIPGPYERKWFQDFHDEMIATRVEAIIAEGKCFVGTFAGNVYALNVADGKIAWQFAARGPIGASACYADGRLFIGSDDGQLYCLNASNGRPLWSYQASASIWVAPACDGTHVYFGDRAGLFHAVDAATGKPAWTYRTEGMILTPASISEDGGRIVLGSEDMHVYCLDPAGKFLWRSGKLGGLSMRDHAPTLWQGLAIVTTNPAISFHHAAGENPAILSRTQKQIPMDGQDKIIFDKWGQYVMKLTPRRLKAEQEAVRAYLAAHPAEQTFYAFQLADGREPWTAPVLYTAGLHNPATPPTFNRKSGELFLWTPSALSNYSAGVPGGAIAVGKLDRNTGDVDLLWHTNGDKLGWSFDFAAPADETQSLSLMGGILLNTHQGIIGGMNLSTLKWHRVYIARDTYGGIFGPALVQGSFSGADKAHAAGTLALMPNEWHGPDRSIVAIGENRMFWVVGSQVVCLGGPDTPKTDTGGTKAPPTIRRKTRPLTPAGNVAAGQSGAFDSAIPRPQISTAQLRKYLVPPAPGKLPESASAMQQKLDAAVLQLIEGGPWAPLIIELGISGEDRYFWRTAETMQILALAVPSLSDDVAAKTRAYLATMYNSGCPLSAPVHSADGRRRELYDLGPEMSKFASVPPKYAANIEDLYAVWAFAHYADGWKSVLPRINQIQSLFDAFASNPARFNHADKDNDAAEHLNAQIAGVLAYIRIMDKAGRNTEAQGAMTLLAELLADRVHHELADTAFVRSTKTAANKLHQAKLPRYLALTPELAQMLRDLAGPALESNVRGLSSQLPVWHQAYGERLIGGENYISPPTLARGLFAALADGANAKPEELIRRLDQPWGRADLYYIEKLSATLRAMTR